MARTLMEPARPQKDERTIDIYGERRPRIITTFDCNKYEILVKQVLCKVAAIAGIS
jgi:hypothetical protein